MADIKKNKEKLSSKGIIIIASIFIIIFGVVGYIFISNNQAINVGSSESSVRVKADSVFDGTLVENIDREVKEQKNIQEEQKLGEATENNTLFVSDLDKDTKVISTSDLNFSFADIETSLSPCQISDYDEYGYHCETGLDRNGYDRDGFNELGLDRNGCDKNGLDLNGNSCISNLEGKECSKEICEDLVPIYNEQGFDREGFDKSGYDVEGFDRNGFDREGFDREGFDKAGYDKEGFNKEGFDRQGFDRQGFDKDGYDREGFNRNGFDREGFDREGFDREGFNKEGFNREGFDREGFDKDGYNKKGCDRNGLDRLGNPCESIISEFDKEKVYDKFGYDEEGYDREGYDREGYDRNGYDKDGYNKDGCDENGLNRLGNPCKVYDRFGYDEEGYDKFGYDIEGYDRKGYDRDGYNKNGCDSNGLNRKGEPCEQEFINGYDLEGFDENGCDRNGMNRAGKTCLDSHNVRLSDVEKLWYDDVMRNKMAFINEIRPVQPMEYERIVNVQEALKEVFPELNEENNENGNGGDNEDIADGGSIPVPVDENNNIVEIPTGSMMYASLLASVNSDYPGIVRARIIGGPYNGALFIGSFDVPFMDDPYRPRDKMQFNFNQMVYKRNTYSINAIGMDLETLNDYVSSYADNHYVTRWGGLIVGNLLKGIGRAAYGSGTGTTEGGETIVSTPITETNQQLRVSVGEIGNELSDIAKQQFYRPPTVVANRGKTLGVYFVTEVNNDELPILFNN